MTDVKCAECGQPCEAAWVGREWAWWRDLAGERRPVHRWCIAAWTVTQHAGQKFPAASAYGKAPVEHKQARRQIIVPDGWPTGDLEPLPLKSDPGPERPWSSVAQPAPAGWLARLRAWARRVWRRFWLLP